MHNNLEARSLNTVASALLALTAICSPGLVLADEAYAKETLDKMSAYLGTQTAVSFDYDAKLDIITDDDQKLSIVSAGSISMERPGKLHATRNGGFAAVEIGFDGQTLTVLNVDKNLYGQVEVPGTIADLIDTMRDEYNRPLPAADILVKDFAALLTPMITEVKDLGAGVISGATCDHFAFRTDEVDLQIWIAEGEEPYPCRYTITNKQVPGWPDYQIDVRNWQTGSATVQGALTLPEGASMVDIVAIPDIDDLAGIYTQEGNQ